MNNNMVIRYQGGKRRIAKKIYEVISEYEDRLLGKKMNIFSPFFGMGSVELQFAKENSSRCSRKIHANDINRDVVLMWKNLKKGWLPKKKITKKEYEELRYSDQHSAERGFYLSAYSFGGVFGSSFRQQYQEDDHNIKEGENAYNAVKNVREYLHCFKFECGSYDEYTPTKDEIVYADPPYNSSLNYGVNKHLTQFDSDEFWNKMRQWSKTNLVFISEEMGRHIPKDFVCIWKKPVSRTIGSLKGPDGKQKREALFIHEKYAKKFDKS